MESGEKMITKQQAAEAFSYLAKKDADADEVKNVVRYCKSTLCIACLMSKNVLDSWKKYVKKQFLTHADAIAPKQQMIKQEKNVGVMK